MTLIGAAKPCLLPLYAISRVKNSCRVWGSFGVTLWSDCCWCWIDAFYEDIVCNLLPSLASHVGTGVPLERPFGVWCRSCITLLIAFVCHFEAYQLLLGLGFLWSDPLERLLLELYNLHCCRCMPLPQLSTHVETAVPLE